MGGSSSRERVSEEEKEAETIVASTGSLPILQNAFSKLSDPNTKSIPLHALYECFHFNAKELAAEASPKLKCFARLLVHLGSSLVDLFFIADKDGINWVKFLRGYDSFCGRVSSSVFLNNLYRFYSVICAKAGIPSRLEFESDDAQSKISGYFLPSDLLMLLWMCWIMLQSSSVLRSLEGERAFNLPDLDHLILSAIASCSENGEEINIHGCDILTLENHISVQKLNMWVLTMVPGLTHAFTEYVNDRLQGDATSEDGLGSVPVFLSDASSDESDRYLLTSGRAWAISLSQRNAFSEQLLGMFIRGQLDGPYENLLYQSSEHGKGLNRFWANVEGYQAPLLILILGSSADASAAGRWVIGVFTQQGFENRDSFYGSSGYLYSIAPRFHIYPPSGKDKNFVYSHLHPTGRVYEAHPKPVGIGFGGTIGNERLFLDEDFAKVIIRHHANDKTYKPGSLIPNQGFLAVEALVIEVEVWGLGGKIAKEKQDIYQERESLFSEQRRKVDLKTFGNWEDSPEKMMMDMVSDPNRVQREDR